MTAEEILKENLNESLWTFISTYPVAYKSDLMLKDWILMAMEEYAKLPIKEQESKPIYDEAYLNECIAKATSRLSKIKDVDIELDEIRGIEQESKTVTITEEIDKDFISFANYFHHWKEKIQRGVCPKRPDEIYKEWVLHNLKLKK